MEYLLGISFVLMMIYITYLEKKIKGIQNLNRTFKRNIDDLLNEMHMLDKQTKDVGSELSYLTEKITNYECKDINNIRNVIREIKLEDGKLYIYENGKIFKRLYYPLNEVADYYYNELDELISIREYKNNKLKIERDFLYGEESEIREFDEINEKLISKIILDSGVVEERIYYNADNTIKRVKFDEYGNKIDEEIEVEV